ncbi:Small ribosomal subunit protein S13, mitochondrial [Morella rubra]|uniref:Small ribosomal subunit protein S13, mitochondrial n=1 Tax=Morella rubra TaxID=262757 RepID=A0A6A1UYC2_9ROSI|nr:Small ribosomal subunit protein S13, mitochondrial [Morella rubra]
MVLPIPRRLGWVSFERRLQKGGYGSSQSVKESPNGLRRLHGVRVQCINIGGGVGEIPDKKRLRIALQHIHGVGRSRARQILSELSIENKPAKDLTGREIYSLREELTRYLTGHDLNNQVKKDIARLMEIQSYRGIRHSQGLPCRGQRTHTNARTWRGKAIPVAGKKKV